MGQENRLFKSEEKKTREEICSFLRLIAEKIESGNLSLKKGQSELLLDFPDYMTLEIQVEDELKGLSTQRSLEIELKWSDQDEDEQNTGALEIG